MVNCSSLGSRWLSRPSPSTWPSADPDRARPGKLSCATMWPVSVPWTFLWYRRSTFSCCLSWSILRHERRRLISLSVTDHPTAEWIARQITEAFPWDQAPHYLIKDRDASYGHAVTWRLAAMGIRDRPTAPRSPWQNGHVERLIGSIRRECLDHVVIFGEAHLRQVLKAYAGYYNSVRTHLSLSKDAPLVRPVRRIGDIVARPILGGLHHEYCRT